MAQVLKNLFKHNKLGKHTRITKQHGNFQLCKKSIIFFNIELYVCMCVCACVMVVEVLFAFIVPSLQSWQQCQRFWGGRCPGEDSWGLWWWGGHPGRRRRCCPDWRWQASWICAWTCRRCAPPSHTWSRPREPLHPPASARRLSSARCRSPLAPMVVPARVTIHAGTRNAKP